MSRPLNHIDALLGRVEDLERVLSAVAAIALQKPETEHSCRRALRQIGALTRGRAQRVSWSPTNRDRLWSTKLGHPIERADSAT